MVHLVRRQKMKEWGGLGRVVDDVFGMFTLTLTPPLNLTHTRIFVQAQSASQRLL